MIAGRLGGKSITERSGVNRGLVKVGIFLVSRRGFGSGTLIASRAVIKIGVIAIGIVGVRVRIITVT